ncbi:PREDICTED: cytochrome P450 [Prunus dulcis]|uniref:PREDICTED: cytochrome P450 n=1 Tax=Prunus dulcis TaxID=3755 RepID=A0A5E4FEL8_PRUDU|nr:cytochrome P450 71A1-like [Prunus dulcis]VVA25870.1 PREDICTED: cytochrome P450 [Prunus dulcis]
MAVLSLFNQMWQQLQSNLFLLPLLVLSIFILFALTRSSSSSGKNQKLKLPPSPPRLPWIGNLHQLGSFPHRSLQALSKKYGNVMLLHLGKVPTLIVSSAEMAKDVMKTQDTVFCSRPQTTAPSILFYDGHDIAFAPYGEYWRQVRRICVLELLSLKRVHQFQYARVEEVAELVSKIRKASASANGAPINLGELLVSTSNNIICRCILGQKFEDKEDNWFGETTKELMTQVMSFSFGDFFPSLKWIDRARGYLAYLKSIWLEFDKFFDKLIDEHKAAQKEGKPRKKDIVDILLDVQKDGSLDFELTTSNVKAILQDMFVGGSDTSWTAAIWLMSELLQNPRVMKKVQEEVRRVAGRRGYVEESDIKEMKYMTCVIKENLRLHPPAPLLLPREAMSDVKLGGYDIPAKTQVFVNAYAVQRDPKVWDKPDEFMPERFEENSVGFVGQEFELIPFGAGRRVCPGLAFGVASAEYVLANILFWFDWKLPSGGSKLAETLDMSEVYGLTVHKKTPLYLIPTPYSP